MKPITAVLSLPPVPVITLSRFSLVHETREAAYKSFIYLDFAGKLAAFLILHCKPDAMQHEPRGLLSYANGAVNLPRTDPVLAASNHPHRSQPLIQAERRILEDRPSLDGKLATVVALIALPAIVLLLEGLCYCFRNAGKRRRFASAALLRTHGN